MSTFDIEAQLGLGPIQRELKIPGSEATEGREVRYVEDQEAEPFTEFFRRLVRHVNPPIAKQGGVLLDHCVLTLPSGKKYQAVSYKGDVEGWRNQIEQGAGQLSVQLGQIADGSLVLSNGEAIALDACTATFW